PLCFCAPALPVSSLPYPRHVTLTLPTPTMDSHPSAYPAVPVYVDCYKGNVVKAVISPYFREPPDFNYFKWADTTNRVTWDHFHLQYLNDNWFYLAWLHRTPFPPEDPMAAFTACFQYETKASLPIVKYTGPDVRSGGFILRLDIEVRNRAWLSKLAFCGMMAYLSFQLAVCRSRQKPGWDEALLAATDINFYNWARGSLQISDTSSNARFGGFVYPFQTVCRSEQLWQRFLRAFLFSRIPLWISFGPKRATFAEQTANATLNSRIALTAEEFAKIEALIAGEAALRPVLQIANSDPPSSSQPPRSSSPPTRKTPPSGSSASENPPLPANPNPKPKDASKYPPPHPRSKQRQGETWQEFFDRRAHNNEQVRLNEDQTQRMARLQRQKANDGPDGQRFTNRSKMFLWERADYPEGYRIRVPVTKFDRPREWEDRVGQRRYDAYHDEWDVCSEFGPDDERWDYDPEDDLDDNGYPNVPPPEVEKETAMDIDEDFDLLHFTEAGLSPSNPNPETSTSAPAPAVPPPPPVPATPPPHPATPTPSPPATTAPPSPPAPTAPPSPRIPDPPLLTSDTPTSSEPLTHATAQHLSADELVDIIVDLKPAQYSQWSNPNTFEDVMRFHYGLVYHVTSPLPLGEPVEVLGWKAEPVADDLKAMAKHLNVSARTVSSADISLVMSEAVQAEVPPRLIRGRYCKGSWDRFPLKEGEYFRFQNNPSDTYRPLLVVHDPAVATHILRRWSHLPTAHVVSYLREHGMAHSLYRDRRSFPSNLDLKHHTADMSTRELSHGSVPVNRVPGVPEFQMYIRQVREFFQVPYRLRAAMQYGGIIWRLACFFSDSGDRSHVMGPDLDSLELGARPVLAQEPTGEVEYWEDALSQEEEEFIVGMYLDHTEKKPGERPAHISWWPTPHCWSQNTVDAIQSGSQPPQTARKFRSSLRYRLNDTAAVNSTNNAFSLAVLDQLVPPPPPASNPPSDRDAFDYETARFV
ncbi:hypothetical protein EIP91_010709, partial [Steccherinum ochraceum]